MIEIGNPGWSREEMLAKLDEFETLYATRPIRNNAGGMLSSEMFATWFIINRLQPKLIIESGIWKGQGTWSLRNACKTAKIISFDLNTRRIEVKCDNTEYNEYDLRSYNWDTIDKELIEDSIVFVDDHVNDYMRLEFLREYGFKRFIFEDNYPVGHGDTFSMKQAFESSPHNKHLYEIVKTYIEMPPIYRREHTRWDEKWDDPTPLIEDLPDENLERVFCALALGSHDPKDIFKLECINYTWLCYVELK